MRGERSEEQEKLIANVRANIEVMIPEVALEVKGFTAAQWIRLRELLVTRISECMASGQSYGFTWDEGPLHASWLEALRREAFFVYVREDKPEKFRIFFPGTPVKYQKQMVGDKPFKLVTTQ
jgi:hypothetical protein